MGFADTQIRWFAALRKIELEPYRLSLKLNNSCEVGFESRTCDWFLFHSNKADVTNVQNKMG